MLSTTVPEKIFNLLNLAKSRAYCPYSNFCVGCVIQMDSGDTVLGCNVENASYSVAVCAERSAICSAIAQGYKKEEMLKFYVITNLDYPAYPCGVCRSAIGEMNKNASVVAVSGDGSKSQEYSIESLIPHTFTKGDLEEFARQNHG